MVRKKRYWTAWYRQNGMNKMVAIKSSINLNPAPTDNTILSSIPLPL